MIVSLNKLGLENICSALCLPGLGCAWCCVCGAPRALPRIQGRACTCSNTSLKAITTQKQKSWMAWQAMGILWLGSGRFAPSGPPDTTDQAGNEKRKRKRKPETDTRHGARKFGNGRTSRLHLKRLHLEGFPFPFPLPFPVHLP